MLVNNVTKIKATLITRVDITCHTLVAGLVSYFGCYAHHLYCAVFNEMKENGMVFLAPI
jgi:hypothetical protein